MSDRIIAVLSGLAILGLLYEVAHDTNEIALGGLVSIATMGMQTLKDRRSGQ